MQSKNLSYFYKTPTFLEWYYGNNAFSYDIRSSKKLTIPCCIDWSISDVSEWTSIVFEDIWDDGTLYSCTWLDVFISTQWNGIPMTIFDNHNHALYFWYDAYRKWTISHGCEIVHVDQHSDLWENKNDVSFGEDSDYESIWNFTNKQCNVGNYVVPLIRNWFISQFYRIEGESDIEKYMDYTFGNKTILNLDLDFFSPDLDYIDSTKKVDFIRRIAMKSSYITVASSPFFIDQKKAIQALFDIFL